MIALFAPPAEVPPPKTVAELTAHLTAQLEKANGPGLVRFKMEEAGRQTALVERRAGPTMVLLVMADAENSAQMVIEFGPNRTRCIEVANNRCWVKEHVNPVSVFERTAAPPAAEETSDDRTLKFLCDNAGTSINLPPKATIARVSDGFDVRIVTLGMEAYAEEEPATFRLTYSLTKFWPFKLQRFQDGKVESFTGTYDPEQKTDELATIEDEKWSAWLPYLVPPPSEEGGGGLDSFRPARSLKIG